MEYVELQASIRESTDRRLNRKRDLMMDLVLSAGAAALSQADTAAKPAFDATEAAIRNLLFPFLILVIGIVFKGIADIRKEHLTNVRMIDFLIAEAETLRQSWMRNHTVFAAAHAGGDQSKFASRMDEDRRYYPYAVIGKSSGSVFAAEGNPAKAFNFIGSDQMKHIVAFHDVAAELDALLSDVREDAFRDLPKPRKLAALGLIIDVYERGAETYEPCIRALVDQKERLTSRSFVWLMLFPLRSKMWIFYVIAGWIAANVALRLTGMIP